MIKAVKGTRDILPPASGAWNYVENVAREVFRTYNYHEIRTPLFEETALFARGVGEDTDIVGKEMYTWQDRDDSSLTLRPEATASVIRAYVEHRLDQIPGLTKLYYMGPMFRRERPQKGRFRQFYQIGAECIGAGWGPADDAEMIEMAMDLVETAGGPALEGTQLLINSVGDPTCRPAYLETLKEKLREVAPRMCTDCQRRAVSNPLRVLDCKVPEDQPIIDELPSILDYLCDFCRFNFDRVKDYLAERGITYYIRPRLVRGLDYYRHTTFEVVHGALGAQSAVLGGGRYDGIAESFGAKVRAPGVGFSIGEDRLVMLMEEYFLGHAAEPLDLYVAFIESDAAFKIASKAASELRNAGVSVEVGDGRLKKSLEIANKVRARFVLIIGDTEVTAGTYLLKNMKSGEQVLFRSTEELATTIKRK